MELMKYQVDGHFVLGGGVGCSPVSVGASNISSNTLPVPGLEVRRGLRDRAGWAGGARFVGMYRAADGKYKSAGTYDSHERAYEVASGGASRARLPGRGGAGRQGR